MAVGLTTRKLGPRFALLLNARTETPADRLDPAVAAEHERLSAFVNNLELGLASNGRNSSSPAANLEVLARFFEKARPQLSSARRLFAEIGRADDLARRQELLHQLHEILHALKESAGAPGLMPIWQLAAATENLLCELVEKPANVTPSALRTVAGALLLLETLCVPGLKSDLADNPPVRLLAVDDDAICRRAVSVALNKHLRQPDVAQNGTQALELVAQSAYDVIFLDVEMPDVDGFEVCSRIRQSANNRTTPVVFITSHSDFDSRTKSFASGGHDLIAKPFLSAEVTVKALTWLLRGRLDRAHPKEAAAIESAARRPSNDQVATLIVSPKAVKASDSDNAHRKPVRTTASPTEEFKFRVREDLLNLFNSLKSASEDPDRSLQELLGTTYISLHAMGTDGDRLGLKSFARLAEGACNLLRKLLEKPKSITPSTPHSLVSAVRALESLCASDRPESPANAPVRALVVDDDAIARRAMANALQLCHSRPEMAESGEAAIELVKCNAFDVIFVDVIMPGIDGFETVLQIRADAAHRDTPVIFVTSQRDVESRARALACGGSSFICKPVLSVEIALVALTARVAGPASAPAQDSPPALPN
jgi:CheY-like chemotaxis protein